MKLAEIEDGVIVNVAVVDPERIPDWMEGWPEVTDAGPGWVVSGKAFTPPPEPEPPPEPVAFLDHLEAQVSAGKLTEGEAIAWAAGTIPDAVLAEIDALPEPERLRAKLEAVSRDPVQPDSPAAKAFEAVRIEPVLPGGKIEA